MFDETPLVRIEDSKSLEEAARELSRAKVIGIDTESDSSYAYREKVCLVQVSDAKRDYIIDPLAVPDLSPLRETLADPGIVKVLHGADYDIVSLKRDHDLPIHGLFDTLIAAQLIGLERFGLADLVVRFFGVELDKQYQRHNWALRPLQPEHIEYARGDTHYLLALHELLHARLERADRVRHQVEECRLIETRTWADRSSVEHPWLRVKNRKDLDDDGLRVLRSLYAYRDTQAQKADRPVYKVLPDAILLSVSAHRPADEAALKTIMSPKSAMWRRHARAVLRAVSDGLRDDTPLPDPKSLRKPRNPAVPKARVTGNQAKKAFNSLKDWRNGVVSKHSDRTPFSVAANGTLQAIAALDPDNLDELRGVPTVRSWQVEDFGDAILAVLKRAKNST